MAKSKAPQQVALTPLTDPNAMVPVGGSLSETIGALAANPIATPPEVIDLLSKDYEKAKLDYVTGRMAKESNLKDLMGLRSQGRMPSQTPDISPILGWIEHQTGAKIPYDKPQDLRDAQLAKEVQLQQLQMKGQQEFSKEDQDLAIALQAALSRTRSPYLLDKRTGKVNFPDEQSNQNVQPGQQATQPSPTQSQQVPGKMNTQFKTQRQLDEEANDRADKKFARDEAIRQRDETISNLEDDKANKFTERYAKLVDPVTKILGPANYLSSVLSKIPKNGIIPGADWWSRAVSQTIPGANDLDVQSFEQALLALSRIDTHDISGANFTVPEIELSKRYIGNYKTADPELVRQGVKLIVDAYHDKVKNLYFGSTGNVRAKKRIDVEAPVTPKTFEVMKFYPDNLKPVSGPKSAPSAPSAPSVGKKVRSKAEIQAEIDALEKE